MKKVLTAIALSVALAGATFAAQPLVKQSDSQGTVTVGVYHPNGSGNQAGVREFDGRILSFGSIDLLDYAGYNGPWEYSAYGRYLFSKDVDALVGATYKNLFGISVYQSEITHRLARYPAIDPALIGTPAAGGGFDLIDLSPDQQFQIARVVNNFNLRLSPWGNQFARFVVNSWQQTKSGEMQRLFRSREAKPGVIDNGKRGEVGLPVDSETIENSVGGDFSIGSDSVVNCQFVDTKFNEGSTGITPGSRLDFLPLNSLTRVTSETKSSIIKVRSSIGKRIFFTGVQTNRQRDNSAATLSSASATINSTNAAVTYLLDDSLTLTGRFRHYAQDNDTAPVLSNGEPTNLALSDSTTSSSIEASYSGIPRTFFKLGYERKNIDRKTTNGEAEFPEIQPSSKSNIVTAGVRWYPNMRLSVSANGEIANADNAGYAGIANDRKKLNADATYMIRDNMAFYGNYNLLDERNDQIKVPFADIPVSAANASDQELREEAAGQGYRNKMATTTLGTWYALNSKLVLDANWARINMDAATTWIIGTDPNYLPLLAPDYVPYQADSSQWSAGATYSFSPKWRVFGRYAIVKSNGHTIIDPAKFPQAIGPTWTPVKVSETRYTLGCNYDMSLRDSLSLEYSLSDWNDHVDSANNGLFNTWQLAWSHQF